MTVREKVLKLSDGNELRGHFNFRFHCYGTCFNSRSIPHPKVTDDFTIEIYVKLNGLEGHCGEITLYNDDVPRLKIYGSKETKKNVCTPGFYTLIFRDLENFLANHWGDCEPEKKQALVCWIENEKRRLANAAAYNKIRGQMDNRQEENLANPEIVYALNNLARALDLRVRLTVNRREE